MPAPTPQDPATVRGTLNIPTSLTIVARSSMTFEIGPMLEDDFHVQECQRDRLPTLPIGPYVQFITIRFKYLVA